MVVLRVFERTLKLRNTLCFILFALPGLSGGVASAQAQTWTLLSHQPSAGVSNCLLSTDGTVMCQSGVYASHTPKGDWYKLTPDLTGSYLNGTWSQIASLPTGYEPQAYTSAVLADGRAVIVGGEYDSTGSFVLSNKGAIYDPKTNTWTSVTPPSGWPYIGDVPAAVLANGQFLIGNKLDTRLALLNPATLEWTEINPTGKGNNSNAEEGWTLLPDGTVLTVDVENAPNSERLILPGSAWITAGNTPTDLHTPGSGHAYYIAPGVYYTPPGEIGPALLRPDGTVFAEGGDGHTAIYTPAAANFNAPGTWAQGPDFPGGLHVDDGPAVLLPDGHVLAAASPGGSSQGLAFFEFDGTNLISVPATSNANSDAATWTSLLLLPNGQVLFVDGSNIVEIYAPAKTYDPSWAPTISSVPVALTSGSTYQITGTQFNGMSQGSAYGDESQNATNYPLVRITNNASGHVFYCRTHGHSAMGVATGSTPVSTNFDVPVNIEPGVSMLVVVANGIPSVPVSVTVTANPPDTTPPTVSITAPTANQTVTGSVVVMATAADNVAVASVQFRLDGNNLGSPVTSAPYQINWNTTTATNTSHSLTAVATDTSNNTGISTAVTVTVGNAGGGPSGSLTDTLVSDFSAGTGTNTYISQIGDGEVIQLPTVGTEFSGTALPTGWTVKRWGSGGSAVVNGGTVAVDGAQVGTSGTYTPGRSLDFVATFTTEGYQHVGFGVDFTSAPWAIFTTRTGGSLLARSNNGSAPTQNTVISGNWLGTPHHYRIDWNATNIVYWIDGVQVATHPVTISAALRPLISDLQVSGQKLVVDWMHMSSYSTPATFTSRVLDAGVVVPWATMLWTVDQPAGTTLAMSVRFGNTPVPDGTWTNFTPVSASGMSLTGNTRYIQHQAILSTVDATQATVLRDVTITFGASAPDRTPPTVSITAPTANQTVTGSVVVMATAADNVAVASVQFKLDGNNLGSPVTSAPYQINWNTTTATNTSHSLTAVATDTSNNTGISTAVTVTVGNAGGGPSGSLTDTLVSDFSAGTGTNTYISQIGDGEVIQLPTVGTEFSGTALPTGWTVKRWGSGGSAVVNGGTVAVDGAQVGTSGTYTPGRSLDFVATFTTEGYQHVGFGVDFTSAPWAIFTTRTGGSLLARSNNGSAPTQNTVISGNWLGTPHHYRIDWNATNIVYWIDGVQVATHPVTISAALRPLISDLQVSGQKLVVDWMHMSSYSTPATFTSRVLDAGVVVPWATMLWTVDQPAETTLAMSVRFGNTPVPDGTWTAFTSVSQSAAALTHSSRYIQYEATLSTSVTEQTVVLRDVTVTY